MNQELFDEYLIKYANSEMLGKYPDAMIAFVDSYAEFVSGERTLEECLEDLGDKLKKELSVTRDSLLEMYLETLIDVFGSFEFLAQVPGLKEFHADFQEENGKYLYGLTTFVEHLQNSNVFKECIFDIVGREDYER